ncbi:hypothetical protein [Pseudorhodoplanes sinuspersici]|uniref:Uncharacterized protein n=1 Tax=Pseudorhodoplanes sinuspersici TaxID=1235591 RepID=A0A1W6ZXT8_9HYPH|nr:hypothetical protein [Pseudorhodoplanes sinuspersici]ARQ02123.1 hypothetical protein CAK95_25755 [Pseudorhodoplanes sinuspersici]RKE73928.1 hypothetical protein DFP91_1826 [Pseudorhodoplanes sinuspersici]
MKPFIAIAVAGAFAVAGLSAISAPAHATQKAQETDFSSASKRSKHVRYYNGYRYGRGYGPVYRRSYAADPSFSPSGRRYRPSVYSPCTIDLGYGRFTSCDR